MNALQRDLKKLVPLVESLGAEKAACRGAAVALPDGAEQAVDVCFDLTAAPAGDFSLAFDGGLTLANADADRTCCLTFTDDAMSGGRTSRYVKLDAPCRRLHVVGGAPAWGCKTLPVKNIFAWNVHFLPNVTF